MDPDLAKLLKNPEDAEDWDENIDFLGGAFDFDPNAKEEEEEIDGKEGTGNGQEEDTRRETYLFKTNWVGDIA